ncbi:MAG: hypothetical protein AAF399_01050 [Bacteroidota bacterium]
MLRLISLLVFLSVSMTGSALFAQQSFFVKNVLDSLYQINGTGQVQAATISPDYPTQGYFGYLTTIDGFHRNYMMITRLSDTDLDSFGLKIIGLDSLDITNVPLSNYVSPFPGPGQFSFHGLEYGALADRVYLAPTFGDSLFQIDLTTGMVSGAMEIPIFENTYSYLHTFHQSEQRYAMIATDAQYQKRFFQVDLDDDTVLISPPMNFPEPLRALEYSEQTDRYYVVSDADQFIYSIDPLTGILTPEIQIPGYQSAFGYLHTVDVGLDLYQFVGVDTSGFSSVRMWTYQPSTGQISSVPFPYPQAGFYGLEATNTAFLSRLVEEAEAPTTAVEPLNEATWAISATSRPLLTTRVVYP